MYVYTHDHWDTCTHTSFSLVSILSLHPNSRASFWNFPSLFLPLSFHLPLPERPAKHLESNTLNLCSSLRIESWALKLILKILKFDTFADGQIFVNADFLNIDLATGFIRSFVYSFVYSFIHSFPNKKTHQDMSQQMHLNIQHCVSYKICKFI